MRRRKALQALKRFRGALHYRELTEERRTQENERNKETLRQKVQS